MRIVLSRIEAREAMSPANARRLWCAIRVNRVGKKHACAKQAENCSNRFNHVDTPCNATVGNGLIAGLCFKTTSSGWKNGFVEPLAKSQWLNSSSY